MRLNTLMKGEVDKQKGWFDFSEARLFWAGNKDRQTSLSREREKVKVEVLVVVVVVVVEVGDLENIRLLKFCPAKFERLSRAWQDTCFDATPIGDIIAEWRMLDSGGEKQLLKPTANVNPLVDLRAPKVVLSWRRGGSGSE